MYTDSRQYNIYDIIYMCIVPAGFSDYCLGFGLVVGFGTA